MGANKAVKPFLGVPLIKRLIHRFSSLNYPMMIVANEPDMFSNMDLPIITDIEPGHGALGGLLTALSIPETKYIGLVACDMPFANPELLRMEYTLIQQNQFDAVVPTNYLGYEPFQAVYDREACVQHVRRCVLAGDRKMINWFDDANIFEYPIHKFDQNSELPEIFYNMNTPADWLYAEKIAKNKGMQMGELV
ncbi:MAG: molybdenum cofactor guanylyltransferase [Anaerolineaceae bacterium]|nr:molybdenum cofactor guanylyltransferase [Anaerolineaceae bacterium]